jgi:hypothetical protein
MELATTAEFPMSENCMEQLLHFHHHSIIIFKGTVRELMGWVRNVVLMNVYLDLENPGGSGSWVRGYMSQVREWGS